jgi:carbamoyl-phosphate synthase large subunit
MGYRLIGTAGTVRSLAERGIHIDSVRKIHEGRPNVLDLLTNGEIDLIINSPSGKGARTDEGFIRASAVSHGVPCVTTLSAGRAVVGALERLRQDDLDVFALQDLLKGE